MDISRPSSLRSISTLLLLAAFLLSCLPACSTARTSGVQRRQDRMNDRTEARADRRQIRSDNMDARTDALFNAM